MSKLTHERARSWILGSATALIMTVVAVLVLRAGVRHHLLHIVDVGGPLPRLTRVLGPLVGGDFARGLFGLWGAAVWLALLLAPLGLAFHALREETPSEQTLRWLLQLSLYLPIYLLVILLTLLALWSPLQFL